MKEADIRPRELMDTYLRLSLEDAQIMDHCRFIDVDCPGCGSRNGSSKFEKHTFTYRQCSQCGSLYCSPRPTQEMLLQFYENSASSEYWAAVFFPAVSESRRKKLFQPKAERIRELILKKGLVETLSICDVGAGYGIFLEELRRVFPNATLCAIEPGKTLAEQCRAKGFETLETYAEGAHVWENRFDLVISSEVIEHVFAPPVFVDSLFKLVKPNGCALVTGLGYEGFDILVLQQDSKSIFPPHHINFMSLEGFYRLFQRTGFRDCEVWTPGVLDIDIVLNSDRAPEFLQVMARRSGALAAFQKVLTQYQLSSHVWVMGSKAS